MSLVWRTTGNSITASDWKLSSSVSLGLSFVSTPSITTPLFLYLRYSFDRSGISFLHGPHHVAQKLITTTLPRIDAIVCAAPVVSMNLTSGRHSSPAHAASAVREEQPQRAPTASIRISTA